MNGSQYIAIAETPEILKARQDAHRIGQFVQILRPYGLSDSPITNIVCAWLQRQEALR